MSNTTTPRIYLACLASYNAGIHHGRWVDVTDLDDVMSELHDILKTSPEPNVIRQDFICSCGLPGKVGSRVFYRQVETPNGQPTAECPECGEQAPANGEPYRSSEEWAIHDTDGFGPVNIGEYTALEDVVTLAEAMEEHGEAFLAYLDHRGGLGQLEDAKDHFEEAFRGTWKSAEDYAEQFCQDVYGDAPKHLANYIDFERMARDWELSGDIFTVECNEGVHVFDGTV